MNALGEIGIILHVTSFLGTYEEAIPLFKTCATNMSNLENLMFSDVMTPIKEGIWSAHMGFSGRRCQIRINAVQRSVSKDVRPMGIAFTNSTGC